jgi:hypothetical protein
MGECSVTTLETRRPTRPLTNSNDGSSVGAPTPHPTSASLEPKVVASGGADASLDRKTLFDPSLALAADILDDTEKVWVANVNRLRILTTPHDQADADGEYRGFGLDDNHPGVARLADMVATLETLTKDATKHLEKVMRRHPLGPWQRDPARKGVGEKQLARLLAAIGDPYWNTLHNRPRTVSELHAYCGYHVLPASHCYIDAHMAHAGRGSAGGGDTSQEGDETQPEVAGVAPRRQRGHKSNWSETARKRAWLIAESIVKAGGPYRDIYDTTKGKYAAAVHVVSCVRCGPASKPAPVDSPLSKAHIHARGLRAIAKTVLRDLWIEAQRLHHAGVQGDVR